MKKNVCEKDASCAYARQPHSPTYLKGLLRDASLLRTPSCETEAEKEEEGGGGGTTVSNESAFEFLCKKGSNESQSNLCVWSDRAPRPLLSPQPPPQNTTFTNETFPSLGEGGSRHDDGYPRTTTLDVHRFTFACKKLFVPIAWSIACGRRTDEEEERERETEMGGEIRVSKIVCVHSFFARVLWWVRGAQTHMAILCDKKTNTARRGVHGECGWLHTRRDA